MIRNNGKLILTKDWIKSVLVFRAETWDERDRRVYYDRWVRAEPTASHSRGETCAGDGWSVKNDS